VSISADDVVCTAHQINFLPGRSVMERVRQADVVIWLDRAQYVRHSFVNRNRFSDGGWMTVPVNEHDTFAPINEVRIADPTGRQREKIARTLEQRLGPVAAPFARELRRPYQRLAALNWSLLQHATRALNIRAEQHLQSMLDGEHPVPAWSENDDDLAPVRDRFADMAAQLGATVWLTGPGRRFGNEDRFHELGIRIETFEWDQPVNPCAIEQLRPLKAVA
jgi:hypothetical protein